MTLRPFLLDKIVVTFVQVLNKVATLYPINLPPVFYSTWNFLNSWNPLVLDLNVLPLNCIVETSFHSRLVGMTIAPIMCIGLIFACYRLRLAAMKSNCQDERDDWKAACIRLAILFVLTIFPPVSTTIFQTFHYDERLADGSAYLKADYAIERQDAEHQGFRIYAITMGVLYCLFIPLGSFFLLLANKKNIQKLQRIEHSRTILDTLLADGTQASSVRKGSALVMPSVVSSSAGEGTPEPEMMPSVLSGTMSDSDGEMADAAQIDDEGDPESEKKQDPEGDTERERALRRMDRRRDALIRGNPVLGGLTPLFAGE
jgi:hypothetical protein